MESIEPMKVATRVSTVLPQRGAHTVVLGCTKAERGHMAPLLEVFAAQEHHVELVSGVDESPQRWREAGQRYGMRAVYVACGGPGLAAAELAALREQLLALGIPATSIWAAVVDWSQLDRLIREVDRMMDAAPVVVPAPPPLSSTRASGPSVVAAPPPPPSPSTIASIAPSVVPAASEGSIAPMLPPTRARLATVEPSREGSRAMLASPIVEEGVSGSRGSVEALDSMDSMVGRRMGSVRRVALALGTVAVAGLVGVVMLARPSSTNADSGPMLADAAVEGTVARPSGEPRSAAVVAARAPAAGHVLAPAQPSALEPTAVERSAGAVADDDALVHAALMDRKIRALDILLVSPEATHKRKGRRSARVLHTHWAGAQAHCEALEVDGVTGWRLPTAGEFRTLGTSNMLGRRIYWSATEGDAFGSDRVVWNNQKKRMAPAPSTWKGGRVLCVRFQRRAS